MYISKHKHRNLNNAVVRQTGRCTARLDILLGKDILLIFSVSTYLLVAIHVQCQHILIMFIESIIQLQWSSLQNVWGPGDRIDHWHNDESEALATNCCFKDYIYSYFTKEAKEKHFKSLAYPEFSVTKQKVWILCAETLWFLAFQTPAATSIQRRWVKKFALLRAMKRRSSTDLTVNSFHVDYFREESEFKRKRKFQFQNIWLDATRVAVVSIKLLSVTEL